MPDFEEDIAKDGLPGIENEVEYDDEWTESERDLERQIEAEKNLMTLVTTKPVDSKDLAMVQAAAANLAERFEVVHDDSRTVQAPKFSGLALNDYDMAPDWAQVEELLKNPIGTIRRDGYRILRVALRFGRGFAPELRAKMPATTKDALIKCILDLDEEEAYEAFTLARQLMRIDEELLPVVEAALKGHFVKSSLNMDSIFYEAVLTDLTIEKLMDGYSQGRLANSNGAIIVGSIENALLRAIATGGPLLLKHARRMETLKSQRIRTALYR